MDENYIMSLGREMLVTVVWVAAPAMGMGMLIGVVMALFQAVTSVQEQTLTMIPKIMGVGLAQTLTMPFILKTLATFSTSILTGLAIAAY